MIRRSLISFAVLFLFATITRAAVVPEVDPSPTPYSEIAWDAEGAISSVLSCGNITQDCLEGDAGACEYVAMVCGMVGDDIDRVIDDVVESASESIEEIFDVFVPNPSGTPEESVESSDDESFSSPEEPDNFSYPGNADPTPSPL